MNYCAQVLYIVQEKTHIEGAELLVQKERRIFKYNRDGKLRNVTTETLRHYDRIGLLPPDYINEHNVRFYSVLKYEKLGTIKELKQLGMSLSEIKAYFENRNYQSSRELLQRQNGLVRNKMKSLIYLQQKIESKICFMDSLEDCIKIGKPYIKILPKRYYISSESKVGNEIELAYEAMQLERKVYENERCLPIYATARYGGIFLWKNEMISLFRSLCFWKVFQRCWMRLQCRKVNICVFKNRVPSGSGRKRYSN